VLYYHHVYERERLTEIVIPGPALAIRKALVYFYVTLILILNFSA
jgi:hypothetical protein